MTFPLAITTQLLLDDTWTDVSSDVRQRDQVQIVRGRSDAAAQTDPSTCNLTLKNTSGDYSPRNPVGAHYGVLGRNTPIRVLTPGSQETYLAVPGDAVSYVSTPDAAALDITGDIDVRIEVTLENWATGDLVCLAEKWENDGDNRSWSFGVTSAGLLIFRWSTDGTFLGTLSAPSTAAVPTGSGRIAVRATLDVNDGAGGLDLKYYTAPSLTGSWTQLGATVHAALTTSIDAGSAELRVGGDIYDGEGNIGFAAGIQGRVHGFELYNGIAGTLVAAPDFTALDTVVTTFDDPEPLTWTIHGGAVVVDPNARFHGEVSTWPPQWDASGADVYTSIVASGVLRRLQQGAPALRSVMSRGLTTLDAVTSVVSYWPCEDGAGATEIASGLPGFPSMTIAHTPTMASFDGFAASNPLPDMGDAVFGGPVPAHASTNEIQVRFLMHVDDGGVAAETVVCRIHTIGSAAWFDLVVNTAGSLKLQAFDSTGATLHDTGYTAFAVNGKLLRVSVELDRGATDIDMNVVTLEVGESTGLELGIDTLAAQTLGRARYVTMAPTRGLSGVAIGHISVENAISSIFDLADELNAYSGETAAARVARLCLQEGVPVEIIGDGTAAAAVGPQLPRTLLELLREAATADMGILYEPRGFLGLAYRTRGSLYAQDPGLELDYSAADLSQVEPVEDDQGTRNDVTVQRVGGGAARAELTTGTLSVNPPPDGVGRYDDQVTVNLAYDTDLPGQASWRLHLGTVDEARYPQLGVNLARSNFVSEVGNFLSVNQASMETSVADWSAGGSVPPTLTQSSTHAQDGTQALRIAWGTGGALPLAGTVVTGLVVGHTYTVSAYAWVPTGDVGVIMAVAGIGLGSAMTTKDAFTRFSVTFVATDPTHEIQVWPDAAPTAGDFAWVDAVQVWEGSAPVTFTTTLAADTATARAETLNVGDKISVANLPEWVSPDGTTQLAQGFTETLSRFEWLIDVNCSPGSPWDVGVYDDEEGPGEARYESESTLAEDLTTSETAVDVAAPSALWSDDDQPFDIWVGGERMRVTAVAGASSPQTFTVTRSINGVVKAHSTGAAVRLFKPAVNAL